MKRLGSIFLVISLALAPAFGQHWTPGSEEYQYNAGPDPKTAMGQEIIRLYAEQPEAKYLSDELSPSQKFRFTFGSMMLRTNFAPNSVKIFAIGQDAVDDAELVKLPGTGTGYSTRVQSIANHFGVDQSLATSNASFQTIKGQYGSFDHIYVEMDKNGKPQIKQSKYVDNYLWSIFNGDKSSMREHREKVWEWQIKNNPESLRMLILFGGASHDAFAEFLIRRGFRVPTRMNEERLKFIQVPESRLVYAGGNNEFPVLLTKDGEDLYAKLLGRAKVDYTKPENQEAAVKALMDAGEKGIQMMAFTGGGKYGSGVLNAAQMGGYDLSKAEVQIGGKWVRTNSLKGLKLSDGSVIQHDIAFVASPHPTSLSKNIADASKKVRQIFEGLKSLRGWKIEPDLDEQGKKRINHYERGEDYKYGRAYLPRQVVPFGAPDTIIWPETSADRLGPQVLVSEPPDRKILSAMKIRSLESLFSTEEIEAAKKSNPAEALHPADLWSQHTRQGEYVFDSGPGAEWAELMVSNLDRSILEPKEGMKVLNNKGEDITLVTHGIEAYNVKSQIGFFGHYRGTFDNPRALILADPSDLEDRNTFRAATGIRGQFVNGLMRDLGLEHSQLVLKTVPVDMNGATAEEWEAVRKGSEAYREAVLEKVLNQGSVEVIFTDGPIAEQEMQRILEKLNQANIPVINIPRGEKESDGIKAAGTKARLIPEFKSASISQKMAAIPASQLPWNSRGWEGNGGGHVVDAQGKFRGRVYAIVTPDYVARQKINPMPTTMTSVENTKMILDQYGVRRASENILDFLKRIGSEGTFAPAAMKQFTTIKGGAKKCSNLLGGKKAG